MNVLLSLESKSRELEPGAPPLGSLGEQGNLLGGKSQTDGLVEKSACLLQREAQLFCPELTEFASHTQTSQEQRRVGTRGDHQVHLRGKVLEQERKGVVNGRC